MKKLKINYSCSGGEKLWMNLYLPIDVERDIPVVLWIEGGEFRGYCPVAGSNADCPLLSLTSSGFAIASIDYRKSQRIRFSSLLSDCKAAVRWLRQNAKEYALNEYMIGATGTGLGGSLALLLASRKSDEILGIDESLDHEGPVQAVVNCSGSTQFFAMPPSFVSHSFVSGWNKWSDFREPYKLGRTEKIAIMKHKSIFGSDERSSRKYSILVSPYSHAEDINSPSLIIHGTLDPDPSLNAGRIAPFYRISRVKKKNIKVVIDTSIGVGFRKEYVDRYIKPFFLEHLTKSKINRDRYSKCPIVVINEDDKEQFYRNFFTKNRDPFNWELSLPVWEDPIVDGDRKFWLTRSKFYSKFAGSNVSYEIYLPPSYKKDTDRKFPVLYYIPALTQNTKFYSKMRIESLDIAIRSGYCPEMIVVFINHQYQKYREYLYKTLPNFFVHFFKTKYKPCKSDWVIIADLIPHIENTYRTIPEKEGRSIIGECASSTHAVALAENFPNMFDNVFAIAPSCNARLVSLIKRNCGICESSYKLHIETGDSDPSKTHVFAIRFSQELTQLSRKHTLNVISGGGHTDLDLVANDRCNNGYHYLAKAFEKYDWRCNVVPVRDLNHSFEYKNVSYTSDNGKSLCLDVYRPNLGNRPTPVVFWIPGADWRGEFFRSERKEYCPAEYLVNHGYAVVSIDYSSSNNSKFPSQIENCLKAINWVKKNESEFQLDCESIAIWGISSGAYLATFIGLLQDGSKCIELGIREIPRFTVKCVVNCFGLSDLTSLDYTHWRDFYLAGNMQHPKHSPISTYLGKSIVENIDYARFASVLSHIHGNMPPFLLLHGTEDSIVSPRQSGLLYRELLANQIDVHLELVNDAGHGLISLNSWDKIRKYFDLHILNNTACCQEFSLRCVPEVGWMGNIQYDEYLDPVKRNDVKFLKENAFNSKIVNEVIGYLYYLPESYCVDDEKEYPVIYFLHDFLESPRDCIHYVYNYHKAILSRQAPESIIVLINGKPRSRYMDTDEYGPMESILINEIVVNVDQQFKTIRNRSFRCIEGIGEGAWAAARFSLKYPETFGLLSMIEGLSPLLLSDFETIQNLFLGEKTWLKSDTRLQIIMNSNIAGVPGTHSSFHELLNKFNVNHDCKSWTTPEGDPLIAFLEARFEIFGFYRNSWNTEQLL